MLKTASLIGLILYFAILLLVVLKEKKNSDVEDYFFAGRSLPFWALSITFIASWWGGGSALSRRIWPLPTAWGPSGTTACPC